MIGPDTIEIAYCDGELYDEIMDTIQPVPAHCVWLTEMESRDGTSLLLDTQTGAYGSRVACSSRLKVRHSGSAC